MKFDRHKDPAACAAKDATRYAMPGVAIVQKGDATFLAATDGRSLSMVRAYPEDGDDMPSILGQGRVYPPTAFVAARRACKRKPDATVLLNGSAYVDADGATTEFARVDGTFPDVLGALPSNTSSSSPQADWPEHHAHGQPPGNGRQVRRDGNAAVTCCPVHSESHLLCASS